MQRLTDYGWIVVGGWLGCALAYPFLPVMIRLVVPFTTWFTSAPATAINGEGEAMLIARIGAAVGVSLAGVAVWIRSRRRREAK